MAPPPESSPQTRWEDDEYVLSRIHHHGEPCLLVRSRFGERPEAFARLERVYAMRDVLESSWAARPLSLMRHEGSDVLLVEDPGGEILAALVGRPWDLRVFLRVAIGIAAALRQLHEQGIVHKDVKPAHILVDVGTGQAWLTGFCIASRVFPERRDPAVISGSPAYMAPEQTAQMNRSVDSRSDLYGFGVTLYQMLTGELPFAATDAKEWIHSHVARAPKRPRERVQDIPVPIEEIVLKLLSKTADERYQTAAGVEADLRRCLTGFESSGRIDSFALASQDVSDWLLIPERLYGFVQIEAIGNELAARFHLDRGHETVAHAYLRAARRCDLRWGALGKVAQLDERHPGIEQPASPGPTTTVEQLDLATVIEVSQAASGEIVLEKLIETVMAHAVERAGAERGLLILLRNDEPWIEAEATTSQDRVAVGLRHAAAGPDDLPESMLRYVVHTRESLILDDASAQTPFSVDPYVRQKRSRSILCLPLKVVKPGDRVEKRGTLCGVLYLENNLASHVFTPARTAVLEVLASQAAISLDNAHLYAELKQAEERTRQAERQVRRVVDTIPALVWTVSPDGRSNFFNQRCLEYTGRSLEEALGCGWTASIHPDDLEQLQATFELASGAGKASEAEARVRRADGAYRWFLARRVPLRDASGQIEGWYGTATDIEDRKRAEQSLRRSEAYLAQAERLSHTGSFGVRLSGGEIVWSKETFRLLGVDEGTKPSLETVLQRTHPEDVPLVRRAVEQATQNGVGMDFEHRLVMPDGSIKHVHVMADAVRDDSGNLELVGAVQDITSSKTAFEEIRTLRDQLYQENVALREEVDKASMFEDIVGSSPALRTVLSRVSRVAPTDSTAFITGETGTGKELIARAIHRLSPRSSRAFVAVNCAAIAKDLIASELFGHEKGAFTGALERRVGRFELAQGGTLFLDEAAEIPLHSQVALLRVLQERRFERVGGSQSLQVDVRVIAATNKELEAAMNAGSFRRDLFYRLNVFPIQVPSLRERREDIPLLVEYFIDRFATKTGKRFRRIHKKSLDLLQSYDWPGNIRELQNVIERSVILCDMNEFSVDANWLASGPARKEQKRRTLDEHLHGEERQIIEAALAEAGGKVSGPSGAAAKLGMPATTLYSKIQSLKIDKIRFKRA